MCRIIKIFLPTDGILHETKIVRSIIRSYRENQFVVITRGREREREIHVLFTMCRATNAEITVLRSTLLDIYISRGTCRNTSTLYRLKPISKSSGSRCGSKTLKAVDISFIIMHGLKTELTIPEIYLYGFVENALYKTIKTLMYLCNMYFNIVKITFKFRSRGKIKLFFTHFNRPRVELA